MRLATYNVNGINGRLPVLLRWLAETRPDVVCLQELKAPQERFPEGALAAAGYGAVWHGQKAWNGVAILQRGAVPRLVRRGLPGEEGPVWDGVAGDAHSRYIEAEIDGAAGRTLSGGKLSGGKRAGGALADAPLLVGCLYMPNGNPAPGPKFDYKLAWFARLHAHAATLARAARPVVLAGDWNVMPTDLDVYKPERWVDDALFRPEVRDAFARLARQGWTDALRTLHPGEKIYTFWDYFRFAWPRNAGLRIDHLMLNRALAPRLCAAGVDREVRGWEKTSDHAPVWIELSAAGPSGGSRAGARKRGGAAKTGTSKKGAAKKKEAKRKVAAKKKVAARKKGPKAGRATPAKKKVAAKKKAAARKKAVPKRRAAPARRQAAAKPSR